MKLITLATSQAQSLQVFRLGASSKNTCTPSFLLRSPRRGRNSHLKDLPTLSCRHMVQNTFLSKKWTRPQGGIAKSLSLPLSKPLLTIIVSPRSLRRQRTPHRLCTISKDGAFDDYSENRQVIPGASSLSNLSNNQSY